MNADNTDFVKRIGLVTCQKYLEMTPDEQALMLAWQKLASYRGDSSFYSWLYRIAGTILRWLLPVTIVALCVGVTWGLLYTAPDFRQGNSYRIIYIHVPAAAVALLDNTQNLACDWLMQTGFSVGIGDLFTARATRAVMDFMPRPRAFRSAASTRRCR